MEAFEELQFYDAIHAHSETWKDFYIRDIFYNGYSLHDWEIAMVTIMGGGLPIYGFYVLKQHVYDIAQRLKRFCY